MLRTGSMLVLSMFASVGVVAAAEQPISASRLVLRHSASGKEKLTFVSKDPAFLFPAIGGLDDPSPLGSAGLVVQLFVSSTPAPGTAIDAPGGVGNQGWSVRSTPARLQFKNRAAPGALSAFRSITLRQAKDLKLNGKETGLDMSAPLGAVGIRITIGSLVNCALFGPGTVTKDANGTFVGRDALASALVDCSYASLTSATVTTTTDGITSSMVPSTTTTTLVGTCGDGLVNQSSEQCDGADAASCLGYACGPPGYATACQCCGLGFTPQVLPCCDPSAAEVYYPSYKQCVNPRCDGPFPCGFGECHDGACCAPLGATCGIFGGGGSSAAVPCCNPAAVCQFTFPSGSCCLPGGNGCSADSDCCSGTCASGSCTP